MKKMIQKALACYNQYQIELRLYGEAMKLLSEMENSAESMRTPYCEGIKQACGLLEGKLTVIEYWLRLLNQNEVFVIKYRIVEDRSWKEIQKLHQDEFGYEGRSARTLKRYRTIAINKMIMFSMEYADTLSLLFGESPHNKALLTAAEGMST